jgi:hypothetical protein
MLNVGWMSPLLESAAIERGAAAVHERADIGAPLPLPSPDQDGNQRGPIPVGSNCTGTRRAQQQRRVAERDQPEDLR